MTVAASTQNKTITVNIDGQNLKATPGASILEVAREAGINIPTLCYHPRLSVVGSCRVCMVAVEGMKGVVPSCATPIRDGMVVKTDTPEVLAARRMAVELLLSTHPLNCDDCESNGRCELQALATELEKQSDFLDELLECVTVVSTKEGSISAAKRATVCFTGKMPETRSYYEEIAAKHGYEPADSVTKELSLLVAADLNSGSSKIAKAGKLGVEVKQLDNWLSSLTATAGPEKEKPPVSVKEEEKEVIG